MTISEILKAKGVADDVIASVLADTTAKTAMPAQDRTG